MSTDPYHAVQQDVQSTLQTVVTLRASYFRIQNMAHEGSEELVWAQNELKATLAALEADLEALDESVRVVESTGPRFFNLGDAEVAERRKYVDRVRKEIEAMRAELEGNSRGERSDSPYGQQPPGDTSRSPLSLDHPLSSEQHQWEREEQQLLIQEQDRTMDSISGTLTNLAHQAGLMGQEIDQHVEMLEDLEHHVDGTDTKLNTAMLRLRKFVRETEETKSGWCITFLIIVLIILLIAVIFA
ncbi:t-SNARE [Pisolithus orientalis]|uniref:t-SNARE n=1 Tax=Pisolithus orientalis TaxID=936130 RepID=UPI0022241C45|nr:t-SNARE [Pisolithus orientalis]KAI6019828.1 t-SNARE [Pisolithus orientalis]